MPAAPLCQRSGAYSFPDENTLKKFRPERVTTMVQQVKSRQRVADHGEVFTAEREVKAMCDLILPETERIDSRFLEPACGDGNFLAEILMRKLAVVRRKYRRSVTDFEKNSLLAVSSLYGVDILADNVEACRERLFALWDAEYKAVCKKDCNDNMRRSIRFILGRNIVCGNALTMMCVDENAQDTNEPIVFSEWAFVMGGQIQRKDYRFSDLLNSQTESEQISLDALSDEGVFLEQSICDYRRLGE